MGVETIAAALGEPRDAIEEIVEPFLIQQGLVQRTPREGMVVAAAESVIVAIETALTPELVREGLARVLPQGLIAGKPVISYDVDGAREVVINEQTGCLLPPRDVSGLVESIIQLAADPARRERYGATGRALCVERFRHQHMTQRLREIYAEVIANKKVPPV